MNKISNKEVISDVLSRVAEVDKDIVVLASDSRGSASMTSFAEKYPQQFVEVGIAEQNLVGIAAGLASVGKKPFITSPACFLTMRSIEQVKLDVAYSQMNVKIVGISGGVSYGALGMSHHSLQDIAVMRAIPGISIIIPADRYETEKMMSSLLDYEGPVYVRVGRNPVEDVYSDLNYNYEIGKAVVMRQGNDITIIATGETVKIAVDASDKLKEEGIGCRVLNMHTIKPLDEEAIIKAAHETGRIITIEEHSIFGGLGAAVAEVVVQNKPVPMKILGIPDEPAIAGNSKQIFDYYGLSVSNLYNVSMSLLK
ncbi:transketolase C-terminal domain-containing protein [Thermoanaerobacterium sp. CMT5567-10]|uniref:transketolase family protein n=1 Tax=Thermoanaerobacterium sp. CMT5567-10 TaxID=3061989 RepID=UPI0026DED63A|nr:transketolase C-terminal domain-containing protein [Thermoanaerobacterium sp. CMT5567-10]WKV10104.1 transketolase C-terminal domain-containing protein [Thermoanaerobacterium sp. CMT5567-10]